MNSSVPFLDLEHAGWQLRLAPTLGGRILSLRAPVAGSLRELMIPAPANLPAGAFPGSAGCYPLVPFSNRIEQAQFVEATRAVPVPAHPLGYPHAIHGFGWTSVWEVEAHAASAATLSHTSPIGDWPWAYRAQQDFVLDDTGLSVTLALHNLSDTPMPCGMGLHPFFPRPEGTRLRTETRSHWVSRPDRIPTGMEPTAGGLGDFSQGPVLPTGLDDGFSGWSRHATLDYGDWQLHIEASAGLDHLVVYSPEGGHFCCVEPVSHVTNAANLPLAEQAAAGWRRLAPGAVWQESMRLAVSALERHR